jgi:hypothetical protein
MLLIPSRTLPCANTPASRQSDVQAQRIDNTEDAMNEPSATTTTFIITDAAVNIYPQFADKVDIIQNAIELALSIGLERTRVAILSAVETVNAKIASTLDTTALYKMADRGQIIDANLARSRRPVRSCCSIYILATQRSLRQRSEPCAV